MKSFDEVVAHYWKTDAALVIEERVREEERYRVQLRGAFDAEMARTKESDGEEAGSQAWMGEVKEDVMGGEARREDAMEALDEVGNTAL